MTLRWRWTIIALAALPLLLCSSGNAQRVGTEIGDRLNRLVNQRFTATKCPGLTIAVAAGNEIVFSAALGFDASAEDLLRFTIAVGTGKILPLEVVRRMWSAQAVADGTESPFGIGWGVSHWKGKAMVGMNGAEPSSTTFLRFFPGSGVGAALLCNAEGAQGLSQLLEDILAAVVE